MSKYLESLKLLAVSHYKGESLELTQTETFSKGFDFAIGLNLAVKFVTFLHKECVISLDIFYQDKEFKTIQEAYDFWIDNIYKAE